MKIFDLFFVPLGLSLVLLPIFWFLREIKAILFWLYLWQLKEYHIGRFLDHFRTTRGRQAVFHRIVLLKVFLIILFILESKSDDITPLLLLLVAIVASLYLAESGKAWVDYMRKTLLAPVFTKKIMVLFLLLFCAFAGIMFLFVSRENLVSLLIIDIFTPVIVSAVVLAFQPLAVIGRNRIVQKAKAKRMKLKKLKVVGITGSYGKTTTKEILAHILSQKFNVVRTPEHKNSEVGISQVILGDLTDMHDIFVCEMGAYNKGGVKLLADIVKPYIGVVTGVNEQHLATFGSMENLLSAEGGKELMEALPRNGAVIINKKSKIKIQNESAKCKIIIPEVPHARTEKDHISFEMEGQRIRLKILGAHNVENFMLAAAAARELGMSLEEIKKAAESIMQDFGAMKLKKGVNELNIIDSAYSANPDGVIAALEYLRIWRGRKVIIMPCLIELGKASREVHRKIGEKIGEVCDLAVITTKDWFEELKRGARSKGMEEGQILFQENPHKIFDMLKNINQEDDVILLESRVPSVLLRLLKANSSHETN